MENEGLKEAFNDMMKEKNALKSRMKSTVTAGKGNMLSSGEDDSDDEMSGSGSDYEENEEGARTKAVS
jgi:hypothetical protein